MKVRALLVTLTLAAAGLVAAAPAQAAGPPAAAVSMATVEAAKADTLAKALEPSAVTKVVGLGDGLVQVSTTPLYVLKAKLPRTGMADMALLDHGNNFWHAPHAAIGNCWGHHRGDAAMYLNGSLVSLLRTFYTGAFNYTYNRANYPNEANKKCATTTQQNPFWGYGGWTLSSKIAYNNGYTAGPNTAGSFYATTWGVANDGGQCAWAHGQTSIPGYGYHAVYHGIHC